MEPKNCKNAICQGVKTVKIGADGKRVGPLQKYTKLLGESCKNRVTRDNNFKFTIAE